MFIECLPRLRHSAKFACVYHVNFSTILRDSHHEIDTIIIYHPHFQMRKLGLNRG